MFQLPFPFPVVIWNGNGNINFIRECSSRAYFKGNWCERSKVTFILTPSFFQRYNQWAENLSNLYPGPVGWGGANHLLPNSFETIRNIQMKLYRMAASNISWGTSNFVWWCFDLAETLSVPSSDTPWGLSNIDCVEALTLLKHQVCRRATFPEEPQTLTVLKHWPRWSIKCAGKR